MNFWHYYVQHNPDALSNILKLADRAYRIGYPFMSDDEFDEIANGETELPIDDNPTDGDEVYYETPMKSQQKTYRFDDVKPFIQNECVASLKLDGFAVNLEYRYGVLVNASTRGKGTYGICCLNHVLAGFCEVPVVLPMDSIAATYTRLNIRGEMIIPNRFADASHTARSIAVGLFKRDDLTGIDKYEPKFFAYDILLDEDYIDRLGILEALGFATVPHKLLKFKDDPLNADMFPLPEYDADGIVIRINDRKLFRLQGETGHHPKGSIALKFKTDIAEATVTQIEWSVGAKTGKMTPIVWIEPVILSGCQIQKLNGGNIAKSLSVGDRIRITRKGGVIPVILEKV